MANERYNVICGGQKVYKDLSEEEYMDVMENFALQFYEQGSPRPDEIQTEIIEKE